MNGPDYYQEVTDGRTQSRQLRQPLHDQHMANGNLDRHRAPDSSMADLENGHPRNGTSYLNRRNEEIPAVRKESPIKAAIQNFGPVWFAFCMNAGILAVVLHNFPYQFPHCQTLASIMFGFDFGPFVVFTCIYLIKIVVYPRHTWHQLTSDPETSCYVGCFPIAWLTNVELIALIVSNSFWGGHWATIVAYVMWWMAVAMMLTVAVFVYAGFLRTDYLTDQPIPLAAFIPLVGVETVATTGGIIAEYARDESAALAVPVIIVSYMLIGIGLFGALMIYSTWFHRFLIGGWPQPEKIPTLCLLVGPMGQASTALQALGTAANSSHRFQEYMGNKGTILKATPAASLDAASIMLALLTFGFGAWWLLIALYGILETALRGRFKSYTLAWYSTIFPLGTMNTGLSFFSVETGGRAFKILTVIFFLVLLIDFVLNFFFTLYGIFAGELLVPGHARKCGENVEEFEKRD